MTPPPLVHSRREFLATSVTGLLGAIGVAGRSARADEPQAAGLRLYVGTYTDGKRSEGIHLVRMDARSGELRLVRSFDGGPNPSFLTVHPDGRVLYGVNEVTDRGGKPTGGVSAFSIDRATGALTRLNEQESAGAAPCYVSVDARGRAVLVANYFGGNVALLPIRTDGSLAAPSHVVQHTGRGPNAQRQEAPHAHWIAADPSNRFAITADLGIDRVRVYRLDPQAGLLRHVGGGDAVMRPGSGPRHIAFHPAMPLLFVANELDSTVTTLRFDRESGKLSPLGTTSTLPAGWSGTNYPADIHVAPSGRTVYVSNRGHDSIAVLALSAATGALTLEQTISTEGDWPRNFTLDPTGRWLLVANQRSDSIVVFARDGRSDRLALAGPRLDVASPVCLHFHANASR